MTALLEDTSSETYDSWATLNTAVPPTKLDKTHTPRAVNVWPDERPGSLVTVGGWLSIGTLPSGNPCRFLYTFTKSDGTAVVLCSDNGTVYTTTDFVNFTSIITGLATAFQLRAITVRNKVWLTNGNDSVRTFDGSSVVALDGSGGTTPNVPKGKFIAFWQERIWVGDISGSRSSVRFTAVTDSSGNDLAPDATAAWPSANEIKFGQDDGDVISALRVYLTVLHVFKAESIYRVDGQDEYTYTPTKTTATTGCRIQESIQERDNLLEFIGRDGVYEFNGARTTKVSDVIESVDLTQFSFNNIQQSSASTKARLWSLQADWNAGTLTGVSASRLVDSVIIDNYTYPADALPASDPSNPWTKSTNRTTSESVSGGILSISCTDGSTGGTMSAAITYTRAETSLSNSNGTRIGMSCRLTSSNVGDSIFLTIDDGTKYMQLKIYPGKIQIEDLFGSPGAPNASYVMNTQSAYHLYEMKMVGTACTVYVDGSAVITYTMSGSGTLGTKQVKFGISTSGSATTASATIDYVSLLLNTSGTAQFISEVYHILDTISSWGAFQADYANNGGSLAFYFRSGTSSGGCTGASWVSITPGSTIGVSTSNVYVQFRVDFTPSGTNSPELIDTTINWNTGTTSITTTQGVASIVYKNRYWLAGALAGATYNNLLIVRGKRIYGTPWVMLGQFNILAFCIFNNVLYAAASNSAALLKLDFGNSANGAAFDSYWETRDEIGGEDGIFNKRWPVIIIAGQRKGNYNLTVDVSIDGGVTYPGSLTKTISLSGSGRFQQELRYSALRAKQLRVRVRTNGVDTPFEVESIKIFWRKSFMRTAG